VSESTTDGSHGEPTNTIVGWADDLGPSTTFVLLRHGETPHTVERRFSGGTGRGGDPGLSDRGRLQVQRAADHLRRVAGDPGTHHAPHPPIDVVLTSPMARTRETAAVVAAALDLPVTLAPGFRECDFGAWDGLTYEQVRQDFGVGLAEWFASTDVAPPEGESFADVQRRIASARDDVVSEHAGRTVLVVTHVTPIKSMVRLALGAPTEALFRMELAPASLSSIEWYADGAVSLRFFNDTAHLSGLPGQPIT
jgi:ribonuclease H / adenosylcobalamin/alpha-ribazole phosphatase